LSDEVKVFVTRRKIGDSFYSEQICARSFEEAQEIAAKFGAEVEGTLEEEMCANCLAVIAGASEPERQSDEWPEDLPT
jgi:hypothetical protein